MTERHEDTLSRRHTLAFGVAALAAVIAPAKEPVPMHVYKDAACGCCSQWTRIIKDAGFKVTVDEATDLNEIKHKYKVPDDLTSCHTGIAKGFVFEGHIPAEDIQKFLSVRRTSLGLAVPDMPTNSPGMEVPGHKSERYTVWEFFKDGSRKPFARHG